MNQALKTALVNLNKAHTVDERLPLIKEINNILASMGIVEDDDVIEVIYDLMHEDADDPLFSALLRLKNTIQTIGRDRILHLLLLHLCVHDFYFWRECTVSFDEESCYYIIHHMKVGNKRVCFDNDQILVDVENPDHAFIINMLVADIQPPYNDEYMTAAFDLYLAGLPNGYSPGNTWVPWNEETADDISAVIQGWNLIDEWDRFALAQDAYFVAEKHMMKHSYLEAVKKLGTIVSEPSDREMADIFQDLCVRSNVCLDDYFHNCHYYGLNFDWTTFYRHVEKEIRESLTMSHDMMTGKMDFAT